MSGTDGGAVQPDDRGGGDDERAKVRRRDRAREDEWIMAALSKAPYGFLATVADDQPFLNSNLFVYDPERHALYMHTAQVGRTRSNLEGAQPVCFSVATMGRMLPADEALEFSVEYAGVTVFGRGIVVEEPAEKERGLQLLLDRYAPHLKPGRDYRPITAQELKRTAVYRIDIEAWSGKQKRAEGDFAGAFDLPGAGFPW
ncbi:MAG: pyridoxamine 5'-phosphate oxidase family protein [Gemmatimonadota bacterium]